MYRLTFYAKALQNYKDAIAWYEERSEEAAERFIIDVKNKLAIICSDPYRYRNMYRNFYETSLQDFPYIVVYLVKKKTGTIIISSVYHHKRNPKKKYKK